MILKYKSKYKFNRILLKDNSYLYCNKWRETVKLADLRMITHGNTWYMKYGFMPYDSTMNRPSDNLLKSIKMNNKILDILETKHINILNILNEAIEKEPSLKNINKGELANLIKKYTSFRDFIIRLTREFDKYCCLLVYIFKVIYNEMPGKFTLTSYYGKTFYLDV
jgi:hypothetical protein